MSEKTKTPEAQASGVTQEQLDAREKQLNAREEKLKEFEKQLNKRATALNVGTVKKVTKKPGYEFKFREEDYKFADDAPEKILFSGIGITQKELAEDQDALVQLIGSGSSLIEKI